MIELTKSSYITTLTVKMQENPYYQVQEVSMTIQTFPVIVMFTLDTSTMQATLYQGNKLRSYTNFERALTPPSISTPLLLRNKFDGLTANVKVECLFLYNTIIGTVEQIGLRAICSEYCNQLKPGFLTGTCGNGEVEYGETCDDGNLISADGCSDVCQEEEPVCCPIGFSYWRGNCYFITEDTTLLSNSYGIPSSIYTNWYEIMRLAAARICYSSVPAASLYYPDSREELEDFSTMLSDTSQNYRSALVQINKPDLSIGRFSSNEIRGFWIYSGIKMTEPDVSGNRRHGRIVGENPTMAPVPWSVQARVLQFTNYSE